MVKSQSHIPGNHNIVTEVFLSGSAAGGYQGSVQDLSDQELLRDYVQNGSEAAFAALVRRHIDLVYSAALRMVVDPHLAEDVALLRIVTTNEHEC